jgi:hypothetical protein
MSRRIAKFRTAGALAMVLATFGPAKASQAPSFGVYGYNPSTWNGDLAGHFPIVVVQYRPWKRYPHDVDGIKQLAASGARVIIDFELWQTVRQRRGSDSRDADEVISQARALLDQLKGVPLEAISLDEENVTAPQRLSFLNDIYNRLKSRYPSRRIVQWVAPAADAGSLRRMSLKSIAADGWIIDPYKLSITEYAKFVAAMKDISPTIYSVVWASPGWKVGGYWKAADPASWDRASWKTFYNRLAVNQRNDIPTIFYLYGLDRGQPRALWTSNSCDRQFYTALTSVTLPYMKQHTLSLSIPASRPSWMPSYCGDRP